MKLRILRKVDWNRLAKTITVRDPSGAQYLMAPTQQYCQSGHHREYRKPYWNAGYVDSELPRSAAYSADLLAITTGFGLADENGNVLLDKTGQPYHFDTIADVERARANASVNFVADISLPEPVEEVAETVDATPEPTDRMAAARAAKAAKAAVTA